MQRLKNLSYTYSAPPNLFQDKEVTPNVSYDANVVVVNLYVNKIHIRYLQRK